MGKKPVETSPRNQYDSERRVSQVITRRRRHTHETRRYFSHDGSTDAWTCGSQHAQGQYPPSQQTAAPKDVKVELKTAITHVGEAAKAESLSTVHEHLGHVINCIAGTKGKDFNASWGNPCEGQGNGIQVDLKTAQGGAAVVPTVQRAESAAMAGLKTKKLADAKKAANQAMALLKQPWNKVQ